MQKNMQFCLNFTFNKGISKGAKEVNSSFRFWVVKTLFMPWKKRGE